MPDPDPLASILARLAAHPDPIVRAQAAQLREKEK
jgi:hypothetical protein